MMTGDLVDLGEGLQVRMGKQELHYNTYDQTTIDILDFNFFLEGKDIGHLDHEFGGFIHERLDDDTLGWYDTEMTLMCQVHDRMCELFPSYSKLIFG